MRDTFPATRRQVLVGGTAGVTGALAGCAGQRGDGVSESDPLLTHDRWGRGETALTYRTSSFYTPIEAQSDQPAAAPALRRQHEAWAEAHPSCCRCSAGAAAGWSLSAAIGV